MLRKIITIDTDKCNGCGICADACHEGAIGMVKGKAQLLREDYCDGLGDCLPACPTNAIKFQLKDVPAYDEAAVLANKAAKPHAGCAGSAVQTFEKNTSSDNSKCDSALTHWPVQIKLLPVNAPYFNNAHLLVAADCTAYAYGNFHNDFIKGRIMLVGCPKLDMEDYSIKLGEIFSANNILDVTVARMNVPCCGGIEMAVKKAVENSRKNIPIEVITISTQGDIIKKELF